MVLFAAPLAAQIAEPNVNMVAGTQWPGGDPFLQRQNEPSLAVSTRNPMHLLAAANDYRTVDLPFNATTPDGEERGDAWLGIFKSRNGGQTWWSTMLAGYPQEVNSTSPLKGYQAAADPVVRAGANGMFYVSGIVLNRDPVANPLGAVFVSRFVDKNNTENGDPIAYVGTSVVEKGTSGAFLDKPWIAVAPGTGQCTIPGQAAPIPAQNVYIVYTTFVGGDNNIRTKLMFARSTDCGVTWGNATKLSESFAINQGATIAVAPNGTVYVVWRRFQSNNESNAIMIAKSTDKGGSFTKGAVVRNIAPFEQAMTYLSIRTNAYPAAAVDESNNLYVVWADRGFHPNQDGRIVLMRSADGVTWTAPVLVDNGAGRGHQFMPTIAIAGGKAVIAYYDLRDDSTKGVFTPIRFPDNTPTGDYTEDRAPVSDRVTVQGAAQFVFTQYLLDIVQHRRHTLDLRAAQANTGLMGGFTGTMRVSQYVFGSRPGAGAREIEQLQYNVPNYPLFRLGSAPFIGDYIDLSAYGPKNAEVYHAVWTDNRDVRPPLDGNWANYTPPASASKAATSIFNGQPVPDCKVGQTGMRNQNIYTTRLTNGVFVGSPGNAKQLIDKNGKPITRAFVVFVQNATKSEKTFHLTAHQPNPGSASFSQSGMQDSIDVTISKRSSATRTVFVSSSDPHASVTVDVVEYANGAPVQDGLTTTTVINPDVSNPDVSNPDVSNPDVSNPDVSNPDVSNPDVSNVEVHNPDVSNPDVSNPDVSNPDVSNPDVSNPDVSNPDVSNPDVSNAEVSNPDVSNPDVSNPDVSNPDVSNATVSDTTWTAKNKGNTTSGYAVKMATNQPVPNGIRTQLIINRVYQTPIAPACTLKTEKKFQIITNLLDPQFTDFGDLIAADPNDSTLWLAPGDAARITLRVYNPDPAHITFDPASTVAPAVFAQASNSNAPAVILYALPLFIKTPALPDAVQNVAYSAQLAPTGGTPPYSWHISLPEGFSISNTGLVTGTFSSVGTDTVRVTLTDSAAKPASFTRQYAVRVAAPLFITTQSLPSAFVNQPYSMTLQAAGGLGAYAWAIDNGALPAGLSLNPTTGVISGTPTTVGNSLVTFRVTDQANPPQTTTQQFGLEVLDPITITTAQALPAAEVGMPYKTSLSAIGGKPPYTWTMTPVQELSLTSGGAINGKFIATGSRKFVATVTDSAAPAQSAQKEFTVDIVPALAIANVGLADGVSGKPYTETLLSTGGIGPMTWSVAPALPAGVSLNLQTGIISGSGTQSTSQNTYTFTVTGGNGSTALKALGLRFFAPAQILTPSLPKGFVNTPYNVLIQATGGTGAFAYTFSQAPPELAIDLPTGSITGLFSKPFSGNVIVTATDSAVPPQVVNRTFALDIVPVTITSVQPLPLAPGFGQLGVFDVDGLQSLAGVSMTFTSGPGAGVTSFGTIIPGPSTPQRLYVRVPVSQPLGVATARVVDANNTGLAQTAVNLTVQPGTPIIQQFYEAKGCAATTTFANAMKPGDFIAISALGIDTDPQSTIVHFEQSGGPFGTFTADVNPCATNSSAAIGLAAVVPVPAQLISGSAAQVSISVVVNGVQSQQSIVYVVPVQ